MFEILDSKFEILSVETNQCKEEKRCEFYIKTNPVMRIGFKPGNFFF